MKKTLLTLSFLALTTLGFNQAYNNSIRINTLGAMFGQYHVFYERAINDQFSAEFSAGLITRKNQISLDDVVLSESNALGFIVMPEFNFYFNESLEGLYAGAFLRYKSVTTKYPDLNPTAELDWSYKTKRDLYGGGILLGYTYTVGDYLNVDIFAGPNFKGGSIKTTFDNEGVTEDDVPEFGVNFFDKLFSEKPGTGIRFGVNIGYAF